MNKLKQTYSFFLLAMLVVLLPSCRKDQLHFQSVTRVESNTTDRLNSILFVNDSTGFIVGGERFASATILTTHDGGLSWTSAGFPEAGKELFGISQAPGGILYTCGYDGKALYSTDTGKTWIFKQLVYQPYKRVVFTSADKGIVIGGISFEEGFMERINGQGEQLSWDSLRYELNDILMLNNHTGFICGYGVMMRTDDGGDTWQILNVKGDNFNAISYCNNEIWVCGYNGSIIHSTNMGLTWEKLRNGNDITNTSYHLDGILFKDAMNGWAVGEKGVVLHSDDGGRHWSEYHNFTSNDLHSIALAPNGNIIVAGDKGTILRLVP